MAGEVFGKHWKKFEAPSYSHQNVARREAVPLARVSDIALPLNQHHEILGQRAGHD